MLYYSHINEDSRLELELLRSANCSEAIAIAGSGERVLALMNSASCKKITVIDVNKEAIFLLQLKIALLTRLSVPDYLKCTGHYPAQKGFRMDCFGKIKSGLSVTCRSYWEQQPAVIEKGILYAGHFENFLEKVRPSVNLLLGRSFNRIFNYASFQPQFFPSFCWRLVTWLFSQQWMYRLWGNKDIAFIGKNACNEKIPVALDRVIRMGNASSCFMAHLIFKGHLRDMAEKDLPPSLQINVLARIRDRLLNGQLTLDYYHGDLLEYVIKHPVHAGRPGFYSVSDILSFIDHAYYEELLQRITKEPGNIIVSRSFLRHRVSSGQMERFSVKYGPIKIYDEQESSGMYQVFSLISNAQAKPVKELQL